MKNFFHFLQYHNFTILAFVILLGFGGTIFAANEIAQQIGREEVVDTRALLGADLDSFDMEMNILSAEEGDDSYTIQYTFSTLSIVNNEWQIVDKEGVMKVAKASLIGTDLETHVYKQLSEIVEQERNYLKKAQAHERSFAENGTPLFGLKGLSLSNLKNVAERGKAFVPRPDVHIPENKIEEEGNEVNSENNNHSTSSPTIDDVPPLTGTSTATSTVENNNATSSPTQTGSSTLPVVVEGCMDPQATNYNSEATEDDGSCEYIQPETQDETEQQSQSQEQQVVE